MLILTPDVNKKEKGSIMKMLPVLLAMAVVAIMTTMYFSYMAVCDTREKADQIARKYILQMETTGFLSENDKNNMLSELSDIGLSGINIQGTTLTKQEYGSEIKLIICADYIVDEMNFNNFLLPVKAEKKYILIVKKKTTAKC